MTYPRVTRKLITSVASAVVATLVARTSAQDVAPTDPDKTNVSAPTPPGVSVPDSPGAVDRLNKAREKEQQRQWKTAADFYHEALTLYARRVLPDKIDKDAGIFRYVGVAQVVQDRLAKWPDEGLTAYRNAYGPAAADLLA